MMMAGTGARKRHIRKVFGQGDGGRFCVCFVGHVCRVVLATLSNDKSYVYHICTTIPETPCMRTICFKCVYTFGVIIINIVLEPCHTHALSYRVHLYTFMYFFHSFFYMHILHYT